MPDMTTVNYDNFFSMFKGEPGTGKSRQALTYPKPMWWASFDQKMPALLKDMMQFKINPKDISYENYKDYTQFDTKLEQFRVNFPYKTLVVDSVTTLADYVLRQSIDNKTGKTTSSGNSAGKKVAGIPVNELEDYSAEAAALMSIIADLKDIHLYHKVDVILIAHVITVTEKPLNGQTVFSRSIVTAGKKPAAKIPAYCDEVYHFNIAPPVIVGNSGDFQIITSHTGDDFARTSLGLPSKFEIGNRSLYDDYVRPSADKLKKEVQEYAMK